MARLAYINSRLADNIEPDEVSTDTTVDSRLARQPASAGKIQEIDLGPDASAWNAQRTELAWQRLEGSYSDPAPKPQKVRKGLGPDGKPWRPRKVYKKSSEELLREKLVNDVLKESALGTYAEEEKKEVTHDDEFVENFKKDYMEQMAARRRPRQPPKPVKKDEKKDDKKRGPKLGGSRNDRIHRKPA
jgi:hypothetical protein